MPTNAPPRRLMTTWVGHMKTSEKKHPVKHAGQAIALHEASGYKPALSASHCTLSWHGWTFYTPKTLEGVQGDKKVKRNGLDRNSLFLLLSPNLALVRSCVRMWRVAAASWKTFPFYRSFWLIVDKTKIAIQTNETVLVKASNCEVLSLFKQLPVYRQIQLDGNFRTYGIFKIAQFGNHCAKPIGLRLCLWWTETFT